jgi:alpha,alpha-trehalase
MGKEYYGIIGNGETCALISPLGSIDWLCLPRFDGDLVFAKALDPIDGESLTLHYMEQKRELAFERTHQEYLPRTNILRTILEFRGLSVMITDFMPWTYRGGDHAIVRHITLRNTGKRSRTIELAVKTRKPMGKDLDHRDLQDDDILAQTEHYAIGVVMKATKTTVRPHEEKSLSLVLCYETNVQQLKNIMETWRHRDIDEVIRSTADFWNNWVHRGRSIECIEHDRRVAERALLCMKLLQYAPTGAFVAAPTASFPAYPGLNDNWDYRFCWIRDTYFACRAFLLAGHFDEVQESLRFLLKLHTNGHWQQPFYAIDGALPEKENVIETLRGPNREINIRINNGARDQLQLDSEGSVLHLLYLYLLFSKDNVFVKEQWEHIVKIADWIVANFERPENGIWEFRGRTMHWTYGKVLCYAGLESACKIADVLGMQKKPSWNVKEKLKSVILKEAWSEQRQAFLQTYEEDAPLDISALAIEEYGLLPADSPRMVKTVHAMEGRLLFYGGVRRYEAAILPFFMPTLWLASHYIRVGDRKKARLLIDNAIANATSLHLAAEHYDPRTGTQHGNYPQLFCMSMFFEQIIFFHHKPSLMENMNLLSLPAKKTAELVEALLIQPLRKLFE